LLQINDPIASSLTLGELHTGGLRTLAHLLLSGYNTYDADSTCLLIRCLVEDRGEMDMLKQGEKERLVAVLDKLQPWYDSGGETVLRLLQFQLFGSHMGLHIQVTALRDRDYTSFCFSHSMTSGTPTTSRAAASTK